MKRQSACLPAGIEVRVARMIRQVACMSEGFDLGNDLDTSSAGMGHKLMDFSHGESMRHGDVLKARQADGTPVIVGKVKNQRVHPPIGHEIDKAKVVVVLLGKAAAVDEQSIHLHRDAFSILCTPTCQRFLAV